MTSPPILPPAEDPRTPHLDLPLPAPETNGMLTDARRIAEAFTLVDDAIAKQKLRRFLNIDL